MSEIRKRRCVFKETKDGEKIPGWFHMWGLEAYETHNQITSVTCGVVEDDEGLVHLIPPSFIQFK